MLYNNASPPPFAPFAVQNSKDYLFTVRDELDLVRRTSQVASPHLVASRGVTVHIDSGSCIRGARARPQPAHAAAKGAVLALRRQFAAEGIAIGLDVNAVRPGVMDTPPVQTMYRAMIDQALVAAIVERTTTGRPGDPIKGTYAGLYLASDETKWVTGINIIEDAGASAVM